MAPRKRSRIRKKQMQSNNEEFIAALTGKYATLMKQLEALKNERIALLKKTLEFARIQIPKAIRDMTLRELKEIEKREECVALVNKRKRVRFSAVVEERSLKRPRGRPRLEDYGPPKRPNANVPLTKCLKAPSPLPCPQETQCRGVGGAEALTVVPKGGSLARAALAVLRVPRRGELAVSAAGSPLLAAATAAGDAPSVLVPLRSGDVLSLQATAHTPAAADVAGALATGLDSAVRVQLRSLASTLRAALDACADGEGGEGGGGGGAAGSTPLSGESAATPGRGYGELDSALRQALGDAGDAGAAPRPPDSTPRRLPARSRIPTRKRL